MVNSGGSMVDRNFGNFSEEREQYRGVRYESEIIQDEIGDALAPIDDGGLMFKDKTNTQIGSFEDLFNSHAFQKMDFSDRKGLQYG